MHLDSVRELKLELMRDVIEALTTNAQEVASFGHSATSTRRLSRFFDTFGLGVQPAGEGSSSLPCECNEGECRGIQLSRRFGERQPPR